MSLNQQELDSYCQLILGQERTRNRFLVLCEGRREKIQPRMSRSPQVYEEKETTPDSSFYKNCTPNFLDQIGLIPRFINCGDCDDVTKVYTTLSKMIAQDKTKQYVHPKKIFAIVDLDNQIRSIDDYQFKTTQDIFFNLYEKTKISEANADSNHTIWVTGLIHKEAYFLEPDLQSFFDNYPTPFFYKDTKISLQEIYLKMAQEIDQDKNLTTNLEVIRPRIKHCIGLDFNDVEELKSNWIDRFHSSSDDQKKRELILTLLAVVHVKNNYWKEIRPERGKNAHHHREELALAIARDFYAKQTDDEAAAKYHIPYFFKMLRKFA